MGNLRCFGSQTVNYSDIVYATIYSTKQRNRSDTHQATAPLAIVHRFPSTIDGIE